MYVVLFIIKKRLKDVPMLLRAWTTLKALWKHSSGEETFRYMSWKWVLI